MFKILRKSQLQAGNIVANDNSPTITERSFNYCCHFMAAGPLGQGLVSPRPPVMDLSSYIHTPFRYEVNDSQGLRFLSLFRKQLILKRILTQVIKNEY